MKDKNTFTKQVSDTDKTNYFVIDVSIQQVVFIKRVHIEQTWLSSKHPVLYVDSVSSNSMFLIQFAAKPFRFSQNLTDSKIYKTNIFKTKCGGTHVNLKSKKAY